MHACSQVDKGMFGKGAGVDHGFEARVANLKAAMGQPGMDTSATLPQAGVREGEKAMSTEQGWVRSWIRSWMRFLNVKNSHLHVLPVLI